MGAETASAPGTSGRFRGGRCHLTLNLPPGAAGCPCRCIQSRPSGAGTDARPKACRADRLGPAKRVAWAKDHCPPKEYRRPPLGAFSGGAWLQNSGDNRPSGK